MTLAQILNRPQCGPRAYNQLIVSFAPRIHWGIELALSRLLALTQTTLVPQGFLGRQSADCGTQLDSPKSQTQGCPGEGPQSTDCQSWLNYQAPQDNERGSQQGAASLMGAFNPLCPTAWQSYWAKGLKSSMGKALCLLAAFSQGQQSADCQCQYHS